MKDNSESQPTLLKIGTIGIIIILLIIAGYFFIPNNNTVNEVTKPTTKSTLIDSTREDVDNGTIYTIVNGRRKYNVNNSAGYIVLPEEFKEATEEELEEKYDMYRGDEVFYKKGVEFLSHSYGRGPETLEEVLETAFGEERNYNKTKDGLYIKTGAYKEEGITWYYYWVLLPDSWVKYSVRSMENDEEFSSLSNFLLKEIRKHRKNRKQNEDFEIRFVAQNEKVKEDYR